MELRFTPRGGRNDIIINRQHCSYSIITKVPDIYAHIKKETFAMCPEETLKIEKAQGKTKLLQGNRGSEASQGEGTLGENKEGKRQRSIHTVSPGKETRIQPGGPERRGQVCPPLYPRVSGRTISFLG